MNYDNLTIEEINELNTWLDEQATVTNTPQTIEEFEQWIDEVFTDGLFAQMGIE